MTGFPETTGIVTGNMQGAMFGALSAIPLKFRTALNSGVNFFEIRTERPIFYTRHLQGPFAVAVHEEYNGVLRKTEYVETWHTGERASVRFEVYEGGPGQEKYAAAYIPDDPWWHNRLIIIDNKYTELLSAYHTKLGVFPGVMATREIAIFHKLITIESTEWGIKNALGTRIASFPTKELAEKDVNEHGYKNHRIEPFIARIKAPHVQQLIDDWTQGRLRSRFGWTDCQQFAAIREQAIKEMRAQVSTMTPQQMAAPAPVELSEDVVIAALLKLPREKLGEVRTALMPKMAEKARQALEQEPFKRLQEMAINCGVKNYKKLKNRKSLVKAILDKTGPQGPEAPARADDPAATSVFNAPVAPPAPPQTEEEVIR